MPPKKAKQDQQTRGLYIPTERHKWITYVEEGQEDDPIQVEVLVRKNLTQGELQTLTLDPIPEFLKDEEGNDLTGEALEAGRQRLNAAIAAHNEAVREAMAPFVVDWNMGYLTPSGERVKADPPAVAGGKQFDLYLGERITSAIFFDLRLRSTGLVKAKSLTPLVPGADTTGDSNSTPSGTEEA